MRRRTSSWFPTKKTSNARALARNKRRSFNPARHSNTFFLNRRIEIPAWRCGWPKQSGRTRNASSTRATSASLRSLSAAKKRGLSRTVGSATLQLSGERLEASGPPIGVQFAIGFPGELIQFLGRRAIFLRRVIFRINLHRTERHDGAVNHHANVLASQGLFQPGPEVLTGGGHSQCLHKVILMSFKCL